jgi:hypothetical protein
MISIYLYRNNVSLNVEKYSNKKILPIAGWLTASVGWASPTSIDDSSLPVGVVGIIISESCAIKFVKSTWNWKHHIYLSNIQKAVPRSLIVSVVSPVADSGDPI